MKRSICTVLIFMLMAGFAFADHHNVVVPYIIKAPAPITIDGNLDEWAFAFPLDHNPNTVPDSGRFKKENPGWYISDFDDCSGTLYMMYDDEYLYVAASVRDDEPGHFSDATWAADGIEFYLANWDIGDNLFPPVNPLGGTPDDATSGDYSMQIGIYFDESLDSIRVQEYWRVAGPINTPETEAQYFIWDEGDGYTIEAKIYLPDLDSPTTGNTFEFTEGYRLPMTWSLYDIDETESSADFAGHAYTPKGYAGWMGVGPGWQACDVMGTPRGTEWNDNAVFDFAHPYVKRVAESRPVTIDGDLGDWNFCFPLVHDYSTIPDSGRFKAENPGWFIADPEDCSGKLMMQYDDEYMYIAGYVRDDEPGHFSDATWAADGIEFYLANWDIGDLLLPEVNPLGGTPDDATSGDYSFQLGVYFDESLDSIRVQEYWRVAGPINTPETDVQYFIWDEGDGYTIEGKIYLPDLDSPTTGNTFEFTEGYRLPMTWSLYDIDETESSADFAGHAYTPKGYAGWMGVGPGWQYADVKDISLIEYIDVVYPDLTDIENPTKGITLKSFEMEQNYPNPFNPTTNIRFSLDKSSKVSLKIYNVNGQLVKTVLNEKLNAGSQQVRVDMANFSSGVYIAVLNNGVQTVAQKMMLVK